MPPGAALDTNRFDSPYPVRVAVGPAPHVVTCGVPRASPVASPAQLHHPPPVSRRFRRFRRFQVRNSMMEALTQHNPKACLADDDVEALATLYPDCSATSMSVAVCHKVCIYVTCELYVTYITHVT